MFGLNRHRHDHGQRYAERRFAREGFEGRGGERHGMGHRRLGRLFDHGNLRFVVLGLIAEKPRHGYEVIKAIEEACGGSYSPSPGVVYPTLTLLEELGHIAMQEAEGGKKRYAITAEGMAQLAANQPVVEQVRARMAKARRERGDGPAPEIVRAMQNLRAAIGVRMGRGTLTAEEVRAIAALLDRTAGEIEAGTP